MTDKNKIYGKFKLSIVNIDDKGKEKDKIKKIDCLDEKGNQLLFNRGSGAVSINFLEKIMNDLLVGKEFTNDKGIDCKIIGVIHLPASQKDLKENKYQLNTALDYMRKLKILKQIPSVEIKDVLESIRKIEKKYSTTNLKIWQLYDFKENKFKEQESSNDNEDDDDEDEDEEEASEEQENNKESFKKLLKEGKLPPKIKKRYEHEIATNSCDRILDIFYSIPWCKKSNVEKIDIRETEKMLNNSHFGMTEVKRKIMQNLCVLKRVGEKADCPIICLKGPPGVGKTSIALSIAKATGRKMYKIPLGGISDESILSGCHNTYTNSRPGAFVSSLIETGVTNPMILLDEIDKVGMANHRGDPTGVLLAALDPGQNDDFVDRFMEVGVDLSNVLYVATANDGEIHPALLSRMDIIELPAYTEVEKLRIAEDYLVPKKYKTTGLKLEEAQITKSAILEIIRKYTDEAGVRSLEREIGNIFSSIVMGVDMKLININKNSKIIVNGENIDQYVGS